MTTSSLAPCKRDTHISVLEMWQQFLECNFQTYFADYNPESQNPIDDTVYPKKYAHGFCFAVLCCGYTLTDFPISIRLTSLALWQSNDCPSASKATLMNMDKYFMWIHYERLHNHNKAKHNKTVCIFLGIYCKWTLVEAKTHCALCVTRVLHPGWSSQASAIRRESLHWRHNEPDGVSNHQPRDCLLNCLFGRRSKKTSKLRVTGLCVENSPGTGELSAQKASNAENVFIWWRHHDICNSRQWHHHISWLNALAMRHSGLQQSARPHIRVSVGDEKWSNSRVTAACKQPTQLPPRDA